MWLAFFGFVAVVAAIEFALRRLGLSGGVSIIVGLLLALLIVLRPARCAASRCAPANGRMPAWSWATTANPPNGGFSISGQGAKIRAYGVADETLRSAPGFGLFTASSAIR